MTDPIEHKIADVYDTATAYVRALDAVDNADSAGMSETLPRVAETLHALRVAVTGECRMCDPGTCPSLSEVVGL